MISFIICLALLIGGYFVYGKVVENTFSPDDRETPAVRINDGVDYVVMPKWKLFLVQLLNIAGLGPIFGALQGALWGPIVFLWITFGTIFAGGVHDYFSGMLSERNEGASISEVCGIYLGNTMKNVMRVFSVVLLVMVGTVFAVGPCGSDCYLAWKQWCERHYDKRRSMALDYPCILLYRNIPFHRQDYRAYLSALRYMLDCHGAWSYLWHIYQCQIIQFRRFGATLPICIRTEMPIWSFMFITVACGAISGFHSTQSPLDGTRMKSENRDISYSTGLWLQRA